jgi:uncharacterized protein YceK
MRGLVVLPVIAALALSGCGAASSTNSTGQKLSGDQKAVTDLVSKLSTAGRRGDAAAICNDVLSKQLLTQLKTAGGDCQTEMKNAIRDASDYDLQVTSVKVSGNNATAIVRQGKKGPTATFTFVKENGNWRASALGN